MSVKETISQWTILQLVEWGTEYLTQKRFDESRLTIELLLSHILKLSRLQLYTNFDKPLSEQELAEFKEKLKRRLTYEPLQYILGETEFMGLPFIVNKHVLIPRPETEILVEKAIEICKKDFSDTEKISLLDIGTGSGCIAISCAKMIPNSYVTALDKSRDAISIAKENAKKNGVEEKIQFIEKDIFSFTAIENKFHIIISNPPYIAKEEFDELPEDIRSYEPSTALTDNGDGLLFFRHIAKIEKNILNDNGSIIVEHAYNQKEKVIETFENEGWKNVESFMDYGKNPRCIIARK